MRKRIVTAVKHPLISGSTLIFSGIFIANLINYASNLIMGRLLSVSDYGLVSTLSSLFVLISIFGGAFNNVFAKFGAQFLGSNNEGGSKFLLTKGIKFVFIFSVSVSAILFILTPVISNFLYVKEYIYIHITIISIFLTLFLSAPQGYLQGRMNFKILAGIHIFQPFTKFVFAVSIVLLGYGVFGPLVGILMSSLLPVVLIFHFLKKNNENKKVVLVHETELRSKFITYTIAVLFAGIGMTLLSNVDIILVRHFFKDVVAGQYAALSLMGKAILYFTVPINFVFFPLIAYKKEKKERLFSTVLIASTAIVLFSTALSFIYFAFPNLVLSIFFPSKSYAVVAEYLGFYSLYILVFSLVALFNSFFLSIGKTGIHKFTVSAALLQICLIYFFHKSLFQVIGVLFFVSLLLLIIFLLYYFKNAKD